MRKKKISTTENGKLKFSWESYGTSILLLLLLNVDFIYVGFIPLFFTYLVSYKNVEMI